MSGGHTDDIFTIDTSTQGTGGGNLSKSYNSKTNPNFAFHR